MFIGFFSIFLRRQQYFLKGEIISISKKAIVYNNRLLKQNKTDKFFSNCSHELAVTLAKEERAYSSYKMLIASKFGFIKSFVCGTEEYNARIKCAQEIENTHRKINAMLKLLK